MNADRDMSRARRYLLDAVSDDERTGVEQEYFRDERALERMEAAEESLIEDYLAGRLDADECALFERNYLSVPHRRRRVDTVRGLISAASTKRFQATRWAPLAAAALLVLALGGWWTLRPGPEQSTTPDTRVAASPPSAAPAVAPPATRVFAFSISPNRVRSAGGGATLVIPDATDIVRLHLRGEGSARAEGARARMRTVAGVEVWRGPAAASDAPAGTVAQIDVPADRLPADDYVIELFAIDAGGAERERARYFLAVRPR